jgi:hypothetical protein
MAVGKEFSAASQVTCENGIFLFDEIEFHDTTYLVLQGNIYDERREQSRVRRGQVENFRAGRNNSIHFHINEPEFVPGRVDIPAASIADEAMEAYFEDSRKDHMLSHHEEIWNLEIEEVEIRRRKPQREPLKEEPLKEPGMEPLLGKMPGLSQMKIHFQTRFPIHGI